MTRAELAAELLRDCPDESDESRSDHEAISEAVLNGADRESVLNMVEGDRWPETWAYLESVEVEAPWQKDDYND
jgi:hypothetical protein